MGFDEALEHLLKHEGGWVNHPSDPGGETNMGVTKQVWEEWLGHPVKTMKTLTPKDVAPLYKKKYWDRIKGDDLPSGIAYCVFDAAVNSGTGRAAKWLQEAVGAVPDGAIGPKTLDMVYEAHPDDLINKMCDIRQSFLEGLKTFETFGKGWTRRVSEVRKIALESI